MGASFPGARCRPCGGKFGFLSEFLLAAQALERFTLEKGKTRGEDTAPPGPKRAEHLRFLRNDRPYGLKGEALQTKNALKEKPPLSVYVEGGGF